MGVSDKRTFVVPSAWETYTMSDACSLTETGIADLLLEFLKQGVPNLVALEALVSAGELEYNGEHRIESLANSSSRKTRQG